MVRCCYIPSVDPSYSVQQRDLRRGPPEGRFPAGLFYGVLIIDPRVFSVHALPFSVFRLLYLLRKRVEKRSNVFGSPSLPGSITTENPSRKCPFENL